ncbi:lipid phosphate phosphatase epsilon 2, chloroplastic-like [Panicum virgatum]|uniref:Phosphatidic acid phosphatase type 2/haloperoxidase domain-containing protein n=1 Tax=Panicum virgatum TaxID=38727 RepID=A0A8T0WUU1_PANVG|nr:lipid phosphate phosphatase epsilon 2, chloroplastic-like [Panicum virgatum]KAG2653301.1 hypothetical protein PVAP13_1NG445300 [Panicum virgatum]
MSSLLLQSPRPRLLLTAPSSRRHLQCVEHLLLPRRSPRVRLGVRMAETAWVESGGGASPEVGVSAEGGAMVDMGRDDELRGPSPEANRWAPVEAALNLMSKWLVAAAYVFAGLWKHDVEIMWVFLGAAVSYLLSLFLKRVLNHERPTDLRSDPGMPSSHAQSLCYAATFLVLSLYHYLGTNYLTMILGPAALSVAFYLSWLRVSQRLHTLNQVMVGAAVGSAFGALWFVLWRSLVPEAVASSPSAKIAAVLVSAATCVSLIFANHG